MKKATSTTRNDRSKKPPISLTGRASVKGLEEKIAELQAELAKEKGEKRKLQERYDSEEALTIGNFGRATKDTLLQAIVERDQRLKSQTERLKMQDRELEECTERLKALEQGVKAVARSRSDSRPVLKR